MRTFAKIGDKPTVSATALVKRLDHTVIIDQLDHIVIIGRVITIIFILYECDGHIVIIGRVIKIILILYESDGQVPKPVTNRLSTPREEEALIYLGIGATVAFLLSAGTLVRRII